MTPDKIIESTSKVTKIPVPGIQGMSRVPDYCNARYIAIQLVHELTGIGPTDIGKHFNRNRVTIYSALKRANKLFADDADYRRTYKLVRKEIA